MCATATTDRSQETIGFVLLTTKALSKKRILEQNSLAEWEKKELEKSRGAKRRARTHRVRDWHCKGDGLEAVALTDAVLLTEGVVGMV